MNIFDKIKPQHAKKVKMEKNEVGMMGSLENGIVVARKTSKEGYPVLEIQDQSSSKFKVTKIKYTGSEDTQAARG
jgi:hypothetical protein